MTNKTLTLNIYNKQFEVERQDATIYYPFKDPIPGVHYYIYLNDRYKVSVIKKYGSIGYEDDLWEIGLLDNHCRSLKTIEDDFELIDNVVGYLTEEEVNNWIGRFYKKYVEES